jgi:hypothetical protein
MAIRIVAPAKVDGEHTYGQLVVTFVDGVAEVEDLPLGVEQYMRGAGYQVERVEAEPEPAAEQAEAVAPAEPEPAAKPARRK